METWESTQGIRCSSTSCSIDITNLPVPPSLCDNSKKCSSHNCAPYRDLKKARSAYQARDVVATKAAHNAESYLELSSDHNEQHQRNVSEYLKTIVFGGLDGIVTIFAIVAGCVGARLAPSKIIIVGLGNLLADAISMGFGEYVSSSAEDDFISCEREREEWEVENCPDDEKQEMVDIYKDRYGFTGADARALVEIAFKYKKFFIQHMMVEELGLMSNGDGPSPARKGLAMFFAFCVFGLLPLGGFVGWLATFGDFSDTSVAFYAACVVSITALFVLGFFKGKFVNQNCVRSGLLMVANGTCAGTVAYTVGALLQNFVAIAN